MWARLGQWLIQRTDSRAQRWAFVIGSALIAAFFEGIFHGWVISLIPHEHMGAIIDATSVGALIGVITYIEISALQARRQRTLSDIKMVAELNHRVRNALQTIAYAARVPESTKQVEIIEECVQKIDVTLKDLFPAIAPPSRNSGKK